MVDNRLYTIKSFIEEILGKEYSIREYRGISREYELTRIAYSMKDDEVVIADVENSVPRVYTGIYSTREKLYRVINAGSDVEAYERILDAVNNPLETRGEESFNDHYRAVEWRLDNIPFIKYYREDGGYYLTSSIVVACLEDKCNASFHRIMYRDSRSATIRIVPRHLHRIYTSYLEMDKDTPVAILLGVHPIIEVAAATSPPFGVYELWVANKLLGKKIPVARTPLYNIVVPVNASIVIEGRITREFGWEGPFVDILMIPDKKRKQPIIVVDRIYVNKSIEPMVHAIVPGLNEHVFLMGFPREAMVWESVRRVADVEKVRLTPASGGWLHAIISIRKRSGGEPKNVIMAAFTGHTSLKHVVVVDSDIDVDDLAEVEWAIATRVQGSRDIVVIKSARGSTLDPSGEDGLVDKVGVDATIPSGKPESLFKRARPP